MAKCRMRWGLTVLITATQVPITDMYAYEWACTHLYSGSNKKALEKRAVLGG